MAISAGELIVRLLLESNSKEVLSAMSADARNADLSLSNLAKTASGFTVTTKGGIIITEDMSRALKEQEIQTGNNIKTTRQFLAEQRFSNRLARETMQAVTAITLAMSFLSDQEGDTNSQHKALAKSLLLGVGLMNATEFSLFAAGKAAEQMGGKMAVLGGRIVALAGPLGIAVGVTSALASYMEAANAEGKRSEKEGVGKFIEILSAASGSDMGFLRGAIETMKGLNAQAKDLVLFTKQMDFGSSGFAAADVTGAQARAGVLDQLKNQKEGRHDIVAELEKELDRQEVLNEFIELARKEILARGNAVQRLSVELQVVNDKLKTGVLVDGQGMSLIEERVRITRELAEILKTADERQADRLKTAEGEYQLGRLSRAEFKAKLEIELTSANTAERRRAIELEIFRINKEELDLAQKINAYWKEGAERAQEQFEKATKALALNRADMEIAGIRDATNKKIAEEKRRYEAQLDLLNDLAMKTQDYDEAETQRRLAAEINRQNLVKIGQDAELAQLELVSNQVGVIGTALHNAFSGAGADMLQKMIAAAQIALQIAKTIELMNAGTLTGALGPLGLIASGLGIFSLFDRGGYTGKGGRYEPAGVVHRGEIVFEKPLVDRHGGDLMALRSMLQQSYPTGGMVGNRIDASDITRQATHAGMLGGREATIQELRAMRREMVSAVDRVSSSLANGLKIDLIRMQAKLRDEDRSLAKYRKSKSF